MFGLGTRGAAELAGGDAAHNAEALRAVFEGRDRGAHRSALLLGAALVLELTGRTVTCDELSARYGFTDIAGGRPDPDHRT